MNQASSSVFSGAGNSQTPSPTPSTESIISGERVAWSIRSRFNPIRGLTPAKMNEAMEMYEHGYIRQAALLWDAIENRDIILKAVAPKRKKDAARNGFEILTVDDSPEAKKHQQFLTDFYNNLSVTHATKLDEHGGVRLMLTQMMDAEGKGWSAHEIIWRIEGGQMRATMKFVPLYFFENITGQLRFLPIEASVFGVPMEPGSWLVHTGSCLMMSCGVSYVLKQLSFKDWVLFNGNFGFPATLGKTPAKKGTPEWDQMVDVVTSIKRGAGGVLNPEATIELLEAKNTSAIPYPPLVEYCDRAVAAIWRGSDLSTISKANNTGASVQQDETTLLTDDDAASLTETLNAKLDTLAIYYQFGTNEPKAYIKVLGSQKKDLKQDSDLVTAAVGMGAKIPISPILQRWNIPQAQEGDLIFEKPVAAPGPFGAGPAALPLPNDRSTPHASQLLGNALVQLENARAEAFKPIIEQIKGIQELDHPEAFRRALLKLKADLPGLSKTILADPSTRQVYQDTLTAAFFNGRGEALVTNP